MVDGTRGKELERRLEEQDNRINELNKSISHGIEKKDKRMEGIEGALKAILEILGSRNDGTDNGKGPIHRNGTELDEGLNRGIEGLNDSEGRYSYSTFANYSQILSPFTHTAIPTNNSQFYPNIYNMPPPIINQAHLGHNAHTFGQNLQNPYLQYANPYMYPPNKFPPKMDFPKFDGTDPRGWAIKWDQFFSFYPMNDLDKVKCASTHFEGEPRHWYQFYHVGRELVPWRTFVNDVISKFASREHEDPQEEFNKLIQLTTVEAYVAEFEELRELIITKQGGLTDEYFISSFLSGLKGEIKRAVKMSKPTSLEEAMELARQAECNMSRSSKPNVYSTQTNSKPSPYTNPQNLAYPATSSNSNSINKPGSQTITPNNTLKPLTSYDINDRRKGLCFHCDEMYSMGHTCKAKFYSLFGEEEEEQQVKEIEFDAEVKGEDPVRQVEEVEGDDPVQQVEVEGGDPVQQADVEGDDPVQQLEVEGDDPVQQVEVEGDDPVQQVEVEFNAKEEGLTCKTRLYSLDYNNSYEVIKTLIQYIIKALMCLGAIVVYLLKLWSRDNGAKGDHHSPRQQSRSISPRSEEDHNTSGRPRSVSQPLSPHNEHNNRSNLLSSSQRESSQNPYDEKYVRGWSAGPGRKTISPPRYPSQSYRDHGARGDHYSPGQQSRSISPRSDRYHSSSRRPRSVSRSLSQPSSSQRNRYQSPYEESYVSGRSASSWRNTRSPSGSLSRSYRDHRAWRDQYSSHQQSRSISPYSDQYRNSFRRLSSFSPPRSQRASSQSPYADYVRDRSASSWRNSRSPPGSLSRSYRDHGAWGDCYSPRQPSRSISPCSDRYRNSSRRPRSFSRSLSQRSSSQRDCYQSPYDENYIRGRSESSWRETRSPPGSPRSYRDHGARRTITHHVNNQDSYFHAVNGIASPLDDLDLSLDHYIDNPQVRGTVVRVHSTSIMSATYQQADEENENSALISFSMLQSTLMEARFSDPI